MSYPLMVCKNGAVVRAVVLGFDDPYVAGLNPTVGRRFLGRDSINRGPMLQQVWYVKEPLLLRAISAKHGSKFAALSSTVGTATK
jgi:hypothetical protein